MNVIYLAVLCFGIGGGLGGIGSWWFTSEHYENVALKLKAETDEKINQANDRANKAADNYETWKAAQQPVIVMQQREVQRELKADPDCSSRPLPVGLRNALTTRSANADTGVADDPLPAALATSLVDVGRPGARLPRSTDGTGGLRVTPSSPR
jgi:hypothetical protein